MYTCREYPELSESAFIVQKLQKLIKLRPKTYPTYHNHTKQELRIFEFFVFQNFGQSVLTTALIAIHTLVENIQSSQNLLFLFKNSKNWLPTCPSFFGWSLWRCFSWRTTRQWSIHDNIIVRPAKLFDFRVIGLNWGNHQPNVMI